MCPTFGAQISKGVVSTLPKEFVSKSAVLLTELVFESDLVSKMADLLTEKGVRRARCAFMPHTMNALNGPEGIEGQIGCARWSIQKYTLHK